MLQKGGPSIEYLNIAHSISVWTCEEQEICWEILVFLHLQRNGNRLFSQNYAHGLAHHESLANTWQTQSNSSSTVHGVRKFNKDDNFYIP
jgi:hypothetical protein